MKLLIGTDEAGYGPNLGPLVITGTSFLLPDDLSASELWSVLEDVLTDRPTRNDARLHVADSKQVYSSGRSIRSLETSVLALVGIAGHQPTSPTDFGRIVNGSDFEQRSASIPPQPLPSLTLPVAANPAVVQVATDRLKAALQRHDIQLVNVQSQILFPSEFNDGVRQYETKGRLLSTTTLKLIRQLVDGSTTKSGFVVCDKHGGRNRYDDLIADAFDDEFVFRIEESGPQSRYRMGDLEFCFRTKAEELLPVAFASMVSKYVREITMLQFNAFWQQHLPDLKPTKGYPVDAARFRDQIADVVERQGMDWNDLWRCR